MTNNDSIPTGELFADLQVSLTEIFLVELIEDETIKASLSARQIGNKRICDAIKRIMKERFLDVDIIDFLEVGFPRTVDLSKAVQ